MMRWIGAVSMVTFAAGCSNLTTERTGTAVSPLESVEFRAAPLPAAGKASYAFYEDDYSDKLAVSLSSPSSERRKIEFGGVAFFTDRFGHDLASATALSPLFSVLGTMPNAQDSSSKWTTALPSGLIARWNVGGETIAGSHPQLTMREVRAFRVGQSTVVRADFDQRQVFLAPGPIVRVSASRAAIGVVDFVALRDSMVPVRIVYMSKADGPLENGTTWQLLDTTRHVERAYCLASGFDVTEDVIGTPLEAKEPRAFRACYSAKGGAL